MATRKRIIVRKFSVPVVDGNTITGMPVFGPPPNTKASGFSKMVPALMKAGGASLNAANYRPFAFKQQRWLANDENVDNLPYDEIAIVLVDKSEAENLGGKVNGGDALLLFYHAAKSQIDNWSKRGLLEEIYAQEKERKSAYDELSEIVEVKPTFFGISLNINKLIRRLFRKRK